MDNEDLKELDAIFKDISTKVIFPSFLRYLLFCLRYVSICDTNACLRAFSGEPPYSRKLEL